MTAFRRRPPRLTVRTRLALLYTMVFLVAGSAMLGVTYVLMRQAIFEQQISVAVLSDPDLHTPLADPDAERQRQQKLEVYERIAQEQYRQATLDSMTRSLALTLVVLLGVGFGVGWLAARQSLRPLKWITATARRVAGGNLDERIAIGGPRDELRELADTFDDMVGRLAAAFDSQRRFVANASHELRTPITTTRTLIEVALVRPDTPTQLSELGAALLQVNERQQSMIDGLLALAESERRLAGTVTVNLCEVLRHAVQALTPEADHQGITVAVNETDAFVDGDPVLLERLATNLVQNAIRHNQPGGKVWASCSTTPSGPEFRVANTGPAMSAQRLDELFEPFRRGPAQPGRPRGNGLGLSIVRAIVAAHGGTVTALPRENGGLNVIVTLPPPALFPRSE